MAAETVLVVDDNPEILAILSARVHGLAHPGEPAEDGEIALRKASECAPALIILDVMMPHKNGWEVARALKQNAKTADIKILMLTAIGESVNEMTSPLYGADAHLDKPFEFSELEGLVSKLLQPGE